MSGLMCDNFHVMLRPVAEGAWYKENQEALDRIYDELVHLRDAMGKKLGYDGYTQLGYYRMQRNCYTKEDVEKFRKESAPKQLNSCTLGLNHFPAASPE